MSNMLNATATRSAHGGSLVRTAEGHKSKRACPCCINLEPRTRDTVKLRRAQRRREAQALRAGRQEF